MTTTHDAEFDAQREQVKARLVEAAATLDALELNPLCSEEHAQKLRREDARAAVVSLAEWLTVHGFV